MDAAIQDQTLANSPVSYGVPMYQALLTVLTILTGGIFFSELEAMHGFDYLAFCCGAHGACTSTQRLRTCTHRLSIAL